MNKKVRDSVKELWNGLNTYSCTARLSNNEAFFQSLMPPPKEGTKGTEETEEAVESDK